MPKAIACSVNAWTWFAFMGLTVGAVLLLLLPTEGLDRLPQLCLYRAIGFTECPGCGITHALSYALHGKISQAVSANRGVALVAPILAGTYLKLAWNLWSAWRSGANKQCEEAS